MTEDKNAQKICKVYAYGFEKKRFKDFYKINIPGVAEIHPIRFKDAHKLDEADGVIIPQGIFEDFEFNSGIFNSRTVVNAKK